MTELELGFRTAINLLNKEVMNLENIITNTNKPESDILSQEALSYRKAIRLLEEKRRSTFTKNTEAYNGY